MSLASSIASKKRYDELPVIDSHQASVLVGREWVSLVKDEGAGCIMRAAKQEGAARISDEQIEFRGDNDIVYCKISAKLDGVIFDWADCKAVPKVDDAH